MTVTKATLATLTANKISTVVFGHIVNYFAAFSVADYRSRGNGNYHIVGSCAVEFSALAVFTVLRDKFVLIAECEQGVCAGIYAKNDISAVSAIATVGTARRYVFFASEGYGTVAAVTGFDINFNVVNKHDVFLSERKE
jgi:hypothetical protein